MLGKSDRNILRAGAPWFAPGLALDYMAKHAIDFWLTTEDLPHPDNRVTVDREGRIHLSKTYYNDEPTSGCWASSRACSASSAATSGDPALVGPRPADPARRHRAQVRHRALRRPTPATSALDVNCRAHDVDNLYVVDTSFFPSSSAVNPALTAMANALRVGDHLLERLGASTTKRQAVRGRVRPGRGCSRRCRR